MSGITIRIDTEIHKLLTIACNKNQSYNDLIKELMKHNTIYDFNELSEECIKDLKEVDEEFKRGEGLHFKNGDELLKALESDDD